MENEKGSLAFKPTHPGEYLRDDILPALNMSAANFARHLGVSRTAISNIVNEKSSVSIEMSIRLGPALRNGARFWLALQIQHDLWEEQQRSDIVIKPISFDGNAVAPKLTVRGQPQQSV